MSDGPTIAEKLAEWAATNEESGALNAVGLGHKTNGGASETGVQMISPKGGGKWGDWPACGELLSTIAQRWSDNIVGGGAQQFVMYGLYGTDPRPKRFFPIMKVSRAMVHASPGMPTDPATPTGLLQAGMRQTELLIEGAFKDRADASATQAHMIDVQARRITELEIDQRELIIVVKDLMLQFAKERHEWRMSEVAAIKSAQLQKRILELLPALLASAGVDMPASLEGQSILNSVAGAFPKPDRDALVAAVASRPNGTALAATLHRWFAKYDEQQSNERQEDERLLREVPLSSLTQAAEDAAGRAIARLEDGKANGTAKNGAAKNGTTNGHTAESPTVVVVEKPDGDAEKLRAMLFDAVPNEEELAGLTAGLRLRGNTSLAAEIERQFAEHQARKGEKSS